MALNGGSGATGWGTWLLLIGLPIVWLVVLLVTLRRQDAAPSIVPLRLGELANLASLFVAVVALLYATRSGAEQGRILDAQRQALDGSNTALQQVVAVSEQSRTALVAVLATLDKSRVALDSQLEIERERQAAERARLSRRPNIRIRHESLSADQLEQGEPIRLAVSNRRRHPLKLLIENVGDAAASRLNVRTAPLPPSVQATLQFGTTSLVDTMPPQNISLVGLEYGLLLSIPDDVQEFKLTILVYADNLEAKIHVLSIVVVSPTP